VKKLTKMVISLTDRRPMISKGFSHAVPCECPPAFEFAGDFGDTCCRFGYGIRLPLIRQMTENYPSG
jgi:hypothetical protein